MLLILLWSIKNFSGYLFTCTLTNFMPLVYFNSPWKPMAFSIFQGVHCVKNVNICSFSGPYFSAFRLNTGQKNSEYGHFSRSGIERNQWYEWINHTRFCPIPRWYYRRMDDFLGCNTFYDWLSFKSNGKKWINSF